MIMSLLVRLLCLFLGGVVGCVRVWWVAAIVKSGHPPAALLSMLVAAAVDSDG
jgi:hypothetical protein